MKFFLRVSVAILLVIFALKAVTRRGEMLPLAENVSAGSQLEGALYRPMDLPGGSVFARRAPAESRTKLTALLAQNARRAELYTMRAQEDERQLDFAAAESDWKLAAQLSSDRRAAINNLAYFYQRRLQPRQEVATLLQAAKLPTEKAEFYRPDSWQPSWREFKRALAVCSTARLPGSIREGVFEAWIARYSTQSEPYLELFHSAIQERNREAARAAADRIHKTFPDEINLAIRVDSELAGLNQGRGAALAVYEKRFTPLWPDSIRASYFNELLDAHQLRTFLAAARTQIASNPTALDPVLRTFFYYEQQQKPNLADQQLLELDRRRATEKTDWTAEELKTVGALYSRISDYDEAARAYYWLHELAAASADDKELALASLISLLLDVPEQSLQFGARDLSLYQNVATMDRHPGFLNGILSLALNTSFPQFQYESASQTAVAYFHRGIASGLIGRMKGDFPSSSRVAALEVKLFAAYAVYGQSDALRKSVPPWLSANQKSPDYTKAALLLADAYARQKRVADELALYDRLLSKLGDESSHRPLGEASDVGENPEEPTEEQVEGQTQEVQPHAAVRSADYARVLDLYISRLTQLDRKGDAVKLYRREIERNPDDPGIYERLALFLEQNHLDSELVETYRAAMAHFDGKTWADKLARFYLREKQYAAYQSLAHNLTNIFDGTKLASFLAGVPLSSSLTPVLYRQVNLYAHERFPHNLAFVRNLLTAYQSKATYDLTAYNQLLRENWFYDPQLRVDFFQSLSKIGLLSKELAALPAPASAAESKNVAALRFASEGHAWLGDYESAAPVFVELAAVTPGDTESTTRATSVERSLSTSVPGAFQIALHLAERSAKAQPADTAAATEVGEIYADRELYSKASPWWNRVSAIHPGSSEGYLDSATVFWDYFQFKDALRVIGEARRSFDQPALWAYQAGVIHENQNDFNVAVDEYLKAVSSSPNGVAGDKSLAEQRLLELAGQPNTAVIIDQKTVALVQQNPPDQNALRLRIAVLEQHNKREDIEALLVATLSKASDISQIEYVKETAARFGFGEISTNALRRIIDLTTDPVEKLQARIDLAKFYQDSKAFDKAGQEYASLLESNPNLLGVVRANVDYYWQQKQPAKAIETLVAAAGRAQQPYRNLFVREAAQKAENSSDYAEARRLLDRLLGEDPYSGDLLAAKASTYAREGDNQALVDFYSHELTQFKAAGLPREEKDARIATLRRGYIGALLTARNYIAALEQYQAVLNLYPEDSGMAQEAARFAETNKLSDRLAGYYQKAAADSPRDYRWPLVLARIDTTLRRYPEAIAAYEKAAYVRPDRPDLLAARADLETRLLRFDAALKTYQKLYELSYHDTQYLVAQADLQARLGNNAACVQLLDQAYIAIFPNQLSGYAAEIQKLAGWHMYSEVDQAYRRAMPFFGTAFDSVQEILQDELVALTILRRSSDAMAEAAAVWRAMRDPKQPASTSSLSEAIGHTVDDFYTPEEKSAFAQQLDSGRGVPTELNVYDLARFSGFAELTAKRLYRSRGREGTWQNLATLQSSRLQYKELGRQLQSIARSVPREQASQVTHQAAEAYDAVGDTKAELALATSGLSGGESPAIEPERYARLLLSSGGDVSAVVKVLAKRNPTYANNMVQAMFDQAAEEKTMAAVEARGSAISGLWTDSLTALTGLYYSSPNPRINEAFNAVLGPRTVGSQLTQTGATRGGLRGDIWFYYAARFGDYLVDRKQPDADDLTVAPLEAAPGASDSYVALGDALRGRHQATLAISQYNEALTISPKRADVHDRLAQAYWADGHKAQAIQHWRNAYRLLEQRVEEGSLPPAYFETARAVLAHSNIYGAAKELRNDATGMLNAYIKRNGSYQFMTFVEGMLDHASDRSGTIAWVVDLSHGPNMEGLLEQLTESPLMTDEEKDPLYREHIARERTRVTEAAGEEAVQVHEQLVAAIAAYAQYLNRNKRPEEAWKTLEEIEPPAERPADLVLRLAALTGHLDALLAAYQSLARNPPPAEQILSVAAALSSDGRNDLALRLEEYEYSRELQAGPAPASAYFGLANVRIEQKRTGEALSLIRDVTLSVGEPFQNLSEAVRLLEREGLKQNATEYASQWHAAEPWNQEAHLTAARLAADNTGLNALRRSSAAPYSIRARSAGALLEANTPADGSTELDLLTHASISVLEASQTFFVLSRLRAALLTTDSRDKLRLYSEAIALSPTLHAERLSLAEAAFRESRDSFGLAAWKSYVTPMQPQILDRTLELDAGEPSDEALRVKEDVAAVYIKRQEPDQAIPLYDSILAETKDASPRTRVEKLKASASRRISLIMLNRQRQPKVTQELVQPGIAGPRYTALPANFDLASAIVGGAQ